MKLYNGQAPNPWRVRVFLAEKGATVPMVDVQILDGSTRAPEFRQINSLGELPVLAFDDGRILTESVAICRYFEAQFPDPPLFGTDAFAQAQVEMWHRRLEQQLVLTAGDIGQHTIPFFAEKIEQMPAYADNQRRALDSKWAWLDTELSDGRTFVTGDRFTLADITGMTALKICDIVDTAVPTERTFVTAWAQRLRGRPSWSA